jgi:hypothetical protein
MAKAHDQGTSNADIIAATGLSPLTVATILRNHRDQNPRELEEGADKTGARPREREPPADARTTRSADR